MFPTVPGSLSITPSLFLIKLVIVRIACEKSHFGLPFGLQNYIGHVGIRYWKTHLNKPLNRQVHDRKIWWYLKIKIWLHENDERTGCEVYNDDFANRQRFSCWLSYMFLLWQYSKDMKNSPKSIRWSQQNWFSSSTMSALLPVRTNTRLLCECLSRA